MKIVNFTINYTKEDDVWVALEPITGTATEGDTFEEAQAMITEALELYFEESDEIPEERLSVTGTVPVHVGQVAA